MHTRFRPTFIPRRREPEPGPPPAPAALELSLLDLGVLAAMRRNGAVPLGPGFPLSQALRLAAAGLIAFEAGEVPVAVSPIDARSLRRAA